MAELFDDHSPLQLGAGGRIALDGGEPAFTLIGRLQYKSEAGVWTVVDFKTDRDLDAHRAEHRTQVLLYAAAIAAATGETARGVLLAL